MLNYDISLELELAVLDLDFALLEDGHFIKRYFRSEFFLKAVDLDELTVQFFFICMKISEHLLPLGNIFSI